MRNLAASNRELRRRLCEAENLLRRGVAMLHRVGWEKGETDDEWRSSAVTWLACEEMNRGYSRTKEVARR